MRSLAAELKRRGNDTLYEHVANTMESVDVEHPWLHDPKTRELEQQVTMHEGQKDGNFRVLAETPEGKKTAVEFQIDSLINPDPQLESVSPDVVESA